MGQHKNQQLKSTSAAMPASSENNLNSGVPNNKTHQVVKSAAGSQNNSDRSFGRQLSTNNGEACGNAIMLQIAPENNKGPLNVSLINNVV